MLKGALTFFQVIGLCFCIALTIMTYIRQDMFVDLARLHLARKIEPTITPYVSNVEAALETKLGKLLPEDKRAWAQSQITTYQSDPSQYIATRITLANGALTSAMEAPAGEERSGIADVLMDKVREQGNNLLQRAQNELNSVFIEIIADIRMFAGICTFGFLGALATLWLPRRHLVISLLLTILTSTMLAAGYYAVNHHTIVFIALSDDRFILGYRILSLLFASLGLLLQRQKEVVIALTQQPAFRAA